MMAFRLRPVRQAQGFDGQDGDYVEQLTFLLFLKMADEQAKPPYADLNKRRDAASTIPKGFGWDALRKLDAVVSANLQRATRLRQSILHKAFSGQLLSAPSLANHAALEVS